MSKNPLSVLNRRHFSCSFPSGTSSSCLYLTVILKFLIRRTMCKLKLKEIILSFFSSQVQLLSKNNSQSCLCIPAGAKVLAADTPPRIPVHSTQSCSLLTHQHPTASFACMSCQVNWQNTTSWFKCTGGIFAVRGGRALMVETTFLIWRKQALQSQRNVLHSAVFSQATGCLFNKCIYLKPVHKWKLTASQTASMW